MNGLTFLGLVAALCSTIAFLPQVIKVWRTRRTHDISREMFLLIVSGAVLWLVYGILEHDLPIVAADLASLTFATTILYFKFRYG
jgi:MtN3 and saliva related transmembrane protein